MDCKIFYSWQSDLPNPTNRRFIGDALEKAVKSIRNDDSIKVEPVIDRDTQNVAGSPDIVKTIFEKIEEAQIFVCDVSIINKDANSRLTPNPNVLIELGYAMKTLGEGKIIMVMNTAFGSPEQLPFDLRTRRVIRYNMPEDNQEKSIERNELTKDFERAIRSILEELEEEIKRKSSIAEIAKKEIMENDLGRGTFYWYTRYFLNDKIGELAVKSSKKRVINEDTLIKGIDITEEVVIEFAGVAEVIATTKESNDAAISLYQDFGEIISRYSQPANFSKIPNERLSNIVDKNRHQDSEFVSQEKSFYLDFYRFIGHELFVIYFSFLIRENRWVLISKTLEKKICYTDDLCLSIFVDSPFIPLNDISQPVELFENSSNNRHSEILNQRHTNGKIAEIVPMQQLIEADFFLFLLSETQTKDSSDSYWHGWSLFYMEQTPKYLLEAKKVDFAEQLLSPLGLETIEELRSLISHAKIKFEQIWSNPSIASPYLPLKNFNPEDIGSI